MSTFFDPELLQTNYFSEYARAKEKTRGPVYFNPYRNYDILVSLLESIADYKLDHARSYAKRIKSQENDWNNCEGVFTEIIIYGYYLRLVSEGFVRSLKLQTDECDIIVERADGIVMYLEAFCVMPRIELSKEDAIVVNDIKTHTQDALSSIRQKLLRKFEKQRQFSKPRENYAVIELNDGSIIGDFHVLSSISDGYKITIGQETGKIVSRGFDWSRTFLAEPAAQYGNYVFDFRSQLA